MELDAQNTNAEALEWELEWLAAILDCRFRSYFNPDQECVEIESITPPALEEASSAYADLVKRFDLGFDERIALALAMAPHLKPNILDIFHVKNSNYDRGFTEFGGQKGQTHGGFLPTGETLNYVLAGSSLRKRADVMNMLSADHCFHREGILKLNTPSQGEPALSGLIQFSNDALMTLLTGETNRPDMSMDFPAKYIETELEWEDLALEPNTQEKLEEIKAWIEHGSTLLNEWGLRKTIMPGYRCLFYGPPGTGKTLTASLLGKATGKDVYRIDISMVVSKFIGETEKNLANVFDQAQNKEWILFFDEADALFGKRTNSGGSNERYSNQEIAYLLQRIENFPGVVILASNIKSNIDEAFSRRFQSTIYFPVPSEYEREQLWAQAFSGTFHADDTVDFENLARQYEVTGGTIVNIQRTCALAAMKMRRQKVGANDIHQAVRKEMKKYNKTLPKTLAS